MQTECSADLFGFARVEGRAVVAGLTAAGVAVPPSASGAGGSGARVPADDNHLEPCRRTARHRPVRGQEAGKVRSVEGRHRRTRQLPERRRQARWARHAVRHVRFPHAPDAAFVRGAGARLPERRVTFRYGRAPWHCTLPLIRHGIAQPSPGGGDGDGERDFFSFSNHRPVILTPACKPCSACGGGGGGQHVTLMRREQNVQPCYGRE
jgi:hypothetical protein